MKWGLSSVALKGPCVWYSCTKRSFLIIMALPNLFGMNAIVTNIDNIVGFGFRQIKGLRVRKEFRPRFQIFA